MDFADSGLVRNALRHAEAEAGFDMAGTLATLEADPVYDLMPIGLRMTGMDRARRYYEHYFANVAPRIVHFALEADPVYDLMPIGLRMTGMERARRYYEHYFANVAPRIVDFALVAEWIGNDGVNQEYDVVYRHDDGVRRMHRILGILTFGATKMTGERIYTDTEMLKIMFAPIWDELEPIFS